MALGDGVRRNIRTLTPEERARFTRALLALQGKRFPGGQLATSPGVRYWFRQIEIQLDAHERRGPEFLPWHRELCNRLEQMLREIDPDLSLHYWDWNEDPRDLFTRTSTSDNVAFAEFGLPFDAGVVVAESDRVSTAPDSVILLAPAFRRLSMLLEAKHDEARFVYFGGTIVNAHISFHDPLAILLHSNVDRLFAMWQAQPGQPWRLDPGRVFGEDNAPLSSLFVEPWSTELLTRPWITPSTPQGPKTYAHPSVVAPPCYDTLPIRISVDEVTNPQRMITFRDVCAGRTFARAASFRIVGRGNLTFTVIDGPTAPYTVITPGARITVAHSPSLYQEARIWFGFSGARPNVAAPAGAVTIRCDQTNEEFVFTLHANTIEQSDGDDVSSMKACGNASDSALCSPQDRVTWTWTWKAAGA